MENNLKDILVRIADNLDDHVKLGQPYDLTFFYSNKVGLTPDQKKIIRDYLEEHFNLWGNTWIKMEADKLREISDCLVDKPVQVLNIERLQLKEHMGYELNR